MYDVCIYVYIIYMCVLCVCVCMRARLYTWVRILHLAEEDNLSSFDSKIVCQSIEINNNKHVCVCAI